MLSKDGHGKASSQVDRFSKFTQSAKAVLNFSEQEAIRNDYCLLHLFVEFNY